jgi:hypothetical protein
MEVIGKFEGSGQKSTPRLSLNMRFVEVLNWCGRFGQEINLLLLPGTKGMHRYNA